MSGYKARSFQIPAEVNWLGNWNSNENLPQSYVKCDQIRMSASSSKFVVEPDRGSNSNITKYYIEPQQFSHKTNLPPSGSTRANKTVTYSTRGSMSPSAHMRSLNYEQNCHKCEQQRQKSCTRSHSSCGSSYRCKSPCGSPRMSVHFKDHPEFSSNPSSRRSSINSPRSCNRNVNANSPFTSIETISIQNNNNRSASRAKYEDFRAQRGTRSFTPTVNINVRSLSNRSSPCNSHAGISVTNRKEVLFKTLLY